MKIILKNLIKTYRNDKVLDVHAVQDISLSIPSNTIFGIIGKSGAGKSTLVRLISLLEKADSGEIWYDDQRVDNLDEKGIIGRRRRIGMIFQNFNLFSSRNAAQNIAYPLEICGVDKKTINKRVAELLELVELSDRAEAPVSTLSGGQKQRIAIARALANNPDILFCDEATSALDPRTTHSILNLIREIQKKMNLTVVMITHQMEVVRDACQQVAVVNDGKIVEQGTVEDIFMNPKSEVTRDFLSNLQPTVQEVQDNKTSENLVRWSTVGGKYYLRFKNSLTDEPVLSNAIKKFNVDFNIRAGGIQHLQENKVGTLITDINGEQSEIEKVIDYLQKNGIIVEKSK